MFRLLKLRPPNGWSAVAWELAIVTLGVVIALGAQEVAQSLHWSREVRETRKALDAELARDLAAFEYRLKQRKCIGDRLTELNRWAESFREGAPIKLKAPTPNLPGFNVRTAVWQLTDGEIAARIPLEARLNYAWLYDALKSFDELKQQEGDAWETVTQYEDSTRLSESDLRAIKRALGNADGINTVLGAFEPTIRKFSRELDVRPEENIERPHQLMAEWNRELCQPLL
jgi:hypothetical protein